MVDAIQLTKPSGFGKRHDIGFEFARALKGIPEIANKPAHQLRPIVKLWHENALPYIKTKPFDETRSEFAVNWSNVKYPWGQGKPDEILKAADAAALPKCAENYDCSVTHRMIKFCREFQLQNGQEPFYLSTRYAGRLFEIHPLKAWRRLKLLVDDGILEIVQPGDHESATRFRFISPDSESHSREGIDCERRSNANCKSPEDEQE